MEKLPAKTGWLWVKEGLALFRKQPAEVSTLFLSYMFLMLALGIVPVIGQLLPLILVPVFAMSFMQACLHIEEGKRVYPNLLLVGFRSPALRSLLTLGVLYLLAASAAVGLSALVDGGVFWKAMTGPGLDPKDIEGSSIRLAMATAAIAYIPAAMAFWFAAPLIVWQKMPLGKALFYSFFAVRRAGKAFAVYGLVWLVIGVVLPAAVSTIVALLINNITVIVFILLPLSIILTVVMYCSFYPTYTAIFGRPQRDEAPAPGSDDGAR
ncbi:BPSS1780 family membrane protein [Herbaspirillum sp. RV1423]|uniref:BPSS1780 family membrane protein n=1 Tax=Herbaspirillum sp. RV1423 TaxID=1443993 RepID=UPI0004B049ED|nr:BPSS1780 family membrane protein [Herbaspirillum sp. RV1423]